MLSYAPLYLNHDRVVLWVGNTDEWQLQFGGLVLDLSLVSELPQLLQLFHQEQSMFELGLDVISSLSDF